MRWLSYVVAALVLVLGGDGPAPAQSPGMAAGDVMRGRFVQERHLKGFNQPLKSEGAFVLVAGRGLIWRVERPFEVTTVITAAGLVQEVNGSETTRLSATRVPGLARLYDMLGGALTGDWRALESQFLVQRRNDTGSWHVVLAPRADASTATLPLKSIVVRGRQFVDDVRLEKPDGDTDVIVFANQVLSRGPLSPAEAGLLAHAAK
ncbi:outer membrane lipoprotein carrier protein LolA [Reyranella sp. CPCC 100927]|uniref:LolA family protein n=1 Tax=Reyranella sp. CPCC 100927 TaxID=2599616 RepID=UPI0011B4ACFB|nr:outer membrane lipoprotein carrier protein LolA [Reyranella sp. CPCC 100927]TWT13693.1 outer membrane lipoprotein carrier protein LolA [Reyranella sp. CPCC 100927]